MVDVVKLKMKMIEQGYTVEMLADKAGMDKSTLYRRLYHDGDPFKIKEADSIANVLKLGREEAMTIFFSQYVA